MVILDEVKRRLSELAPEVTDLHDALAIERSRVRLEELEQKSASPEFYDDAAASGAVFAEMGELKDRLEQYAALQTMLEDSGMQLLLYMNGMWTTSGWTVNNEYAPALHGAADLLAEWLANAVNNEKIKSDTNDRLVAMAEALAALGYSDAASEALAAAQNAADSASSTASTTESVISDATQTLQQKFNVKIFQLVLLIVAAAAIFMLILSCAMFANHHSKRKKEFEKKQRAARKAAARKRKAAKQRREREE